jgi:hypothetical protein
MEKDKKLSHQYNFWCWNILQGLFAVYVLGHPKSVKGTLLFSHRYFV